MTPDPKQDARQVLARRFDVRLRAELTPEQYAEVVARNRRLKPTDHHCHSHDFCDANMVMLAALGDVTGSTEPPDCDVEPEDPHQALWNAAWNLWIVQYCKGAR